MLIERGADPNAAGAGYAALHAAVLRGDADTVKALLAKGANPDVAHRRRGSPVRRFGSQWALTHAWIGATPLFVATVYLEMDLMRVLLAAAHRRRWRCRMARRRCGWPRAAKWRARCGHLMWRGGHPGLRHARDSAPRSDLVAASRLLLDHGASVTEANAAGDTALHAAAPPR